jgi:transcription elongation factor Elf1
MNSVGHGPPIAAVIVALVISLAMLVPVLYVARRSHHARRALCTCPRCWSRATREVKHAQVGATTSRVAVQCGQCGLRRRVVVDDTDRDANHRRLQRDRRAMDRQLRRLEADRRAFEIHGFIALLRSDVGGPDDFLAHTRAPTTPQARAPGDA